MNKSDIRKASLAKRDALNNEEIEEKSRRIFEKLMELELYRGAENILVYASMRSEVITDDIILDALANGKKVFCPKVTDKNCGIMEFVRILSPEDLKEGYFGIREPEIHKETEIADSSCAGHFEINEETGEKDKESGSGKTLVIMPGVAFDKSRSRIGYGGGFYDRYLKAHADFEAVALAFDCQIYDEDIPSSSEDMRPFLILTETRLIS